MANRTADQLKIGQKVLNSKRIDVPCTQIPQPILQAALDVFNQEERGELLYSIALYSLTGQIPPDESKLIKATMIPVRKSIDQDKANYAYTVAHNAYAGYCSQLKRLYPNIATKVFEDWLDDWIDGSLVDLE